MQTADASFIRPLKNIEVEVLFQKTRFKAVCSAFPECKGFGKSQDEAIAKLCTSISKFISQVTRDLVENIIHDALQGKVPQKSHVDTPDHAAFLNNQSQRKAIPILRYPEDRGFTRIPAEKDIHSLLSRLQHMSEDMDSPMESEIEDFYMGFPLSLN